MKKLIFILLAVPLVLCSVTAAAATPNNATHANAAAVYGEQLGDVMLPFTCAASVTDQAKRGLALLHHMTYAGARQIFAEIARQQPDCALGYWGQAMSYIHPLWSDPPSAEQFEQGRELAAAAKSRVKNDQEQAFVATVTGYYGTDRGAGEKPNLQAFAKAWHKVYQGYPENTEAASFYALANLATADPADKSYRKQKQSAAIAEQVLQAMPAHPGGHHYIIHAFDYPALAAGALEVARNYGNIAPAVPHALHMPSHIFTRLGLWQESIAMNRRSADAALQHPVDGKISLHYLHALDYLAYAYLQCGQDQQALQVLDEMAALQGPFQTHVASAYTFAAVPARIALERQQWEQAAQLKASTPSGYAWENNPAMAAITYFANGLGAARLGNSAAAGRAIQALSQLQAQAQQQSAYWGKQVEIQRLSVEAWQSYGEGGKDAGLSLMRKAAALEATTEKHPVTPGEVLPAHELLADMLMLMGNHEEAYRYYLATLERSPNRFNSLYGAGRAAQLSGDRNAALQHYQALLATVAGNGNGLTRLQQAKAYIDGA